jgi:hypothetical protein
MIRFRYFGDRGKTHTNVITCASIIEGDHIRVAFACSNINDVYDKHYGKLKVLKRLENNYSVNIELPVNYTVHDITDLICDYIYDNPEKFPSWAASVVFTEQQNRQNKNFKQNTIH